MIIRKNGFSARKTGKAVFSHLIKSPLTHPFAIGT